MQNELIASAKDHSESKGDVSLSDASLTDSEADEMLSPRSAADPSRARRRSIKAMDRSRAKPLTGELKDSIIRRHFEKKEGIASLASSLGLKYRTVQSLIRRHRISARVDSERASALCSKRNNRLSVQPEEAGRGSGGQRRATVPLPNQPVQQPQQYRHSMPVTSGSSYHNVPPAQPMPYWPHPYVPMGGPYMPHPHPQAFHGHHHPGGYMGPGMGMAPMWVPMMMNCPGNPAAMRMINPGAGGHVASNGHRGRSTQSQMQTPKSVKHENVHTPLAGNTSASSINSQSEPFVSPKTDGEDVQSPTAATSASSCSSSSTGLRHTVPVRKRRADACCSAVPPAAVKSAVDFRMKTEPSREDFMMPEQCEGSDGAVLRLPVERTGSAMEEDGSSVAAPEDCEMNSEKPHPSAESVRPPPTQPSACTCNNGSPCNHPDCCCNSSNACCNTTT